MADIPLTHLQQMFDNMRTEAGWEVSGNLLWGYFFTDPQPSKLELLAKRLEAMGYRVVDLYETDDRSTHFLHVERVETHTPESLDLRNREFNQLATDFGVESYDGMDVGPVSQAGH